MKNLTGTEKQVKWAEDIRKEKITYLEKVLEDAENLGFKKEEVTSAIENYSNIEDSAEIINNRFEKTTLVNMYKSFINKDEVINKVKEDEKIMKRILKINEKEEDKKQSYIENTASIIIDTYNVNFKEALEVINNLK